MKHAKPLSLATTACLAPLALGFSMLWHDRRHMDYGPSGQYFDAASGVSYSDNAVLVYAALAMACGVAMVLSAWWMIRVWRG